MSVVMEQNSYEYENMKLFGNRVHVSCDLDSRNPCPEITVTIRRCSAKCKVYIRNNAFTLCTTLCYGYSYFAIVRAQTARMLVTRHVPTIPGKLHVLIQI